MARTSPINVAINAIDNVSPTLEGIVARGTMMGNVMTGALQQIGNLAGSVFNRISTQYQSAADRQMSFIGTAGSLMHVLNVGYEEALATTERLDAKFVELGARLPGTAEDFSFIGQSISDDLFNAFRGIDGTVDVSGAEETLMQLTERWGLFAQQTNTVTHMASQNLVRLMSGDVNVLRMVQFDKSPAFKNALDRVLAADQKTRDDWEDATTRQRAEWINEAVGMTIPPEAVEAMSTTISGTINQWRSSLFDATSGIFGFLRDIESRGGSSIMEGLEGVVASTNKMVEAIVRIWPFKGDVLAPLYDALVWIRKQIDAATAVLSPSDAIADLQEGTADLSKAIGESLRRAAMRATVGISDISQVLSEIDFTTVFSGIVSRVTSGMESLGIDMGQVDLGSITQALGGYVSDFQTLSHSVGKSIINGLLSLFNMIVGSVADMSFDTSIISGANFGAMIGKAVGRNVAWLLARVIQLLSDTDWGAVRRATANILMGVGGAFVGLIAGLSQGFVSGIPDIVGSILSGFSSVGAMIGGIMDGFINGMARAVIWIDGIVRPIEAWANNLDASIQEFATAADASILAGVMSVVDATASFGSSLARVPSLLGDAVTKAVGTIKGSMGDLASPVLEAIRGIFSGITSALSNVASRVSSMIPGVSRITGVLNRQSGGSGTTSGGGSTTTTTGTGTTGNQASSGGSASPPSGSAPSLAEESQALRTQHSASGHLKPLLDSIRSEKRAMPAGSHLVVANSSETILNRNQTRTLGSYLSRPVSNNQTRNNTATINATFNISGATNPDTVARVVLQHLDKIWSTA